MYKFKEISIFKYKIQYLKFVDCRLKFDKNSAKIQT